ncbi:MAG TPA: hypothetical protein VFV38_20430 [Ktedonobacteraceae bacterium]|nr:hypothetical protein [Ktedonobacteraceae bacterium]
MNDTDTHDLSILLEQIRDQNKVVLECIAEMPKIVTRLSDVERDVAEFKQDVKVIKAVVTDMSRQVNDPEHRISRLEAA